MARFTIVFSQSAGVSGVAPWRRDSSGLVPDGDQKHVMDPLPVESNVDMLAPALVGGLAPAYNDRDFDAVRDAVRQLCARLVGSGVGARWHPLGFFRIELGRDDAGRRCIVHCWPEGARSTQDPAWLIHHHAWNLESCILAGQLTELEYEPAAQEATEHGVLYLASGMSGHISRLERTGQDTNLALRGRHTMAAGHFYRVDIGHFHQSLVPIRDHCLTLARTGPRLLPNSQVLGDRDGPHELIYRHDEVDPALVRHVLEHGIGGDGDTDDRD